MSLLQKASGYGTFEGSERELISSRCAIIAGGVDPLKGLKSKYCEPDVDGASASSDKNNDVLICTSRLVFGVMDAAVGGGDCGFKVWLCAVANGSSSVYGGGRSPCSTRSSNIVDFPFLAIINTLIWKTCHSKNLAKTSLSGSFKFMGKRWSSTSFQLLSEDCSALFGGCLSAYPAPVCTYCFGLGLLAIHALRSTNQRDAAKMPRK